jgi:hypothetical protein
VSIPAQCAHVLCLKERICGVAECLLSEALLTCLRTLWLPAEEMWEVSMRGRLYKWVMPKSHAQALVKLRKEMDEFVQMRLAVGANHLHNIWSCIDMHDGNNSTCPNSTKHADRLWHGRHCSCCMCMHWCWANRLIGRPIAAASLAAVRLLLCPPVPCYQHRCTGCPLLASNCRILQLTCQPRLPPSPCG